MENVLVPPCSILLTQREGTFPVRNRGSLTQITALQREKKYRQIYFEAYDHVVNSSVNHFDQPDSQACINVQKLLLKSIQGSHVETENKMVRVSQLVRLSEFEKIGLLNLF